MQKHLSNIKLEKSTSDGYDARFVVSSTGEDRVGDTFSKDALQKLSATKKTIALYNHDAGKPCGYWTNFKMVGNKLVASLKLAETNLGKMIRSLLDSGVPLASSCGFRVLDWEETEVGYQFKDVDLMEISVVSTPANPQAILLAKKFGFDDSIFTTSKSSARGQLKKGNSKVLSKVNNSISRIEQCLQ